MRIVLAREAAYEIWKKIKYSENFACAERLSRTARRIPQPVEHVEKFVMIRD